jgi:CHAT domain-containing protein
VVASLWRVDDEATGILMKAFYSNLLQGIGKAEALARAQREMRESYEAYRHPYLWAAFVLTGDGGKLPLSKSRN